MAFNRTSALKRKMDKLEKLNDLEILDENFETKVSPKEKKIYNVDPVKFKEEIKPFYETGVCSVFLAECLNNIAVRLSYNPKFINYSYKEEMIGDALIKMFSALKRHKFDINSGSSPFGYFYTISFHAFINRIKKEKKQHEALLAYREHKYEELMASPGGHVYVKPSFDSTEHDVFGDK